MHQRSVGKADVTGSSVGYVQACAGPTLWRSLSPGLIMHGAVMVWLMCSVGVNICDSTSPFQTLSSQQTVYRGCVCLHCYAPLSFTGLLWLVLCPPVAPVIGGLSGDPDPADGSIASLWSHHAWAQSTCCFKDHSVPNLANYSTSLRVPRYTDRNWKSDCKLAWCLQKRLPLCSGVWVQALRLGPCMGMQLHLSQ